LELEASFCFIDFRQSVEPEVER